MINSDVHISLAQPNDREALLALHQDVRHATDRAIVPEYADATVKANYYQKLWCERFPEVGITVLKAESQDGHLMGFCSFGRPYIKEYPAEYPDEKLGVLKDGLAELHQLYVTRDRHNHGLGRMLYDAALDHLKDQGYRHVMIAVHEGNTSARSFYEKMGAAFHFSIVHHVTRGDRVFHNRVGVYVHRDVDVRAPSLRQSCAITSSEPKI